MVIVSAKLGKAALMPGVAGACNDPLKPRPCGSAERLVLSGAVSKVAMMMPWSLAGKSLWSAIGEMCDPWVGVHWSYFGIQTPLQSFWSSPHVIPTAAEIASMRGLRVSTRAEMLVP